MLVLEPIIVVIPPSMAAKLSGIISRLADQFSRPASNCMIGMNITTTGVLFRNAEVTSTAAKQASMLVILRR